MRSIQDCLSKDAVITRFTKFGQIDLVHVVTVYLAPQLQSSQELTQIPTLNDESIEKKALRAPTKEEVDQYGDEMVVVLLHGKNKLEETIYNYVSIKFKNYFPMRDAIKMGGRFDVREFGEIIEAGQGEPTQEVKDKIESQFKYLSFPSVL